MQIEQRIETLQFLLTYWTMKKPLCVCFIYLICFRLLYASSLLYLLAILTSLSLSASLPAVRCSATFLYANESKPVVPVLTLQDTFTNT